jgi:hypothetical protein
MFLNWVARVGQQGCETQGAGAPQPEQRVAYLKRVSEQHGSKGYGSFVILPRLIPCVGETQRDPVRNWTGVGMERQ